MSVVCSRCSNIYEPPTPCPRCGAPCPVPEQEGPSPGRGPRWQQTPWGRILIGLILAQGLFYGLRHLATGILLATSEGGAEAKELWGNVQNILILQGIQLVSLLAGGLLAGGGQRAGLVLGALVGTWNGVLAVLLKQNPAHSLTLVGLYGQPLLHTAFGALGGLAGGLVWRPIPVSGVPSALTPPRKAAPRRRDPMLAGPIAWFRVLAGSAFAVAGTLSATAIFQRVLDLAGTKLATTSALQDEVVTWEIKALAVLVGAALAGATTRNGLKQGVAVGMCASAVLIGIQAPLLKNWVEVALLTLVSTMGLSLAGGWFGGQLFPPVIKIDRRRSLDAARI